MTIALRLRPLTSEMVSALTGLSIRSDTLTRYVPIPWEEFKTFLRKNLGDCRAFVASIWSKFKRGSQYQLEGVQDWASHLEHLQSILQEFDPSGAFEESDLICYFQEALRPSIKAEMENLIEEYEN